MPDQPTFQTAAQFTIPYLQYLNADRVCTQALPHFATPDTLRQLYRAMATARAVDQKAIKLQRTGQLGTYPACLGQEAIGVAIGSAMQHSDVYCPYYRETATLMARGVQIEEIYAIWGGDERGNNFSATREDFSICVPIATQCLHAAGIAFAMQHRQQNRAVVTTIGEGGTSKGDFYEAINLAGAWQLPMVCVVNNNQWAISVPRHAQTGTQTIAQKAIAAGIPGIQVDGNDVIALKQALTEALDRARSGGGATLIEAVTYRLCDHTTADDATRYQSPESVKIAWQQEPIARLAYYLEAEGHWDKSQEAAMQADIKATVEAAAERYRQRSPEPPTAMFDSLYATLPDAYLDQYDALLEESR